jgi:hypothetical protein
MDDPDVREVDRPSDCARIVRVAAAGGYVISPAEAEVLWEYESGARGWLALPADDGELLRAVERYATAEDDEDDEADEERN